MLKQGSQKLDINDPPPPLKLLSTYQVAVTSSFRENPNEKVVNRG